MFCCSWPFESSPFCQFVCLFVCGSHCLRTEHKPNWVWWVMNYCLFFCILFPPVQPSLNSLGCHLRKIDWDHAWATCAKPQVLLHILLGTAMQYVHFWQNPWNEEARFWTNYFPTNCAASGKDVHLPFSRASHLFDASWEAVMNISMLIHEQTNWSAS